MESAAIINDTPTPIEFVSTGKTIIPDNGMIGLNGLKTEGSQNTLLPTELHAEIKSEPPEDIIDTPCTGMGEEDSLNDSSATNSPNPMIRLTPTNKLMASPKPVDPKRKFACPYDNCTKSYGKSSHLRSHLTWHTGIKPFVCQVFSCGKGFTRSDELNRHVRTHTGEKPFECVQCTKKFSRSDHLTKHLATHAKQMERDRERGDTTGEGRQPKKAHKEKQKNDNFGNMHFMEALMENSVRIAELSNAEPKREADQYLIGHVPIKIKLERPVNTDEYHVVPPPLTTQHQPNISELKEDLSQQLMMPAAAMVGIPLSESKNDTNYDDAIMPEANLPPLPMVSTGFSIPHYEQLAEEVAYDRERAAEEAYGKDRPFRCNQCIKCFKRQDDLNRHLRTHSGETPFSCSECDKRFKRSDHLKKHLKTHTKVEPGLLIPNTIPMPELPVPDLPVPATMT